MLSKSDINQRVAGVVSDWSRAEQLYDLGYIRRKVRPGKQKGPWQDRNDRIVIIKKLIEVLEIKIDKLCRDDFVDNGLEAFLNAYYRGSPYETLLDISCAYSIEESLEHARTGSFRRYEDDKKIYPWQRVRSPTGFYQEKDNRIAAVKWLVWKTGKEPRDLTQQDFIDNGLDGPLTHNYNGSPFEAVFEAGLVTHADEPYMKRHGTARFRDLEN